MVDGNPATGEFNPVAPIPVTMGTEHVLSITIDFGNMAITYDLTDTSEANNYGWGNSFDGENNKLTITNNSTCKISARISYNKINKEIFFLLNTENEAIPTVGTVYEQDYLLIAYDLTYAGDQTEETVTSCNTYLTSYDTVFSSEVVEGVRQSFSNSNFNEAKIGEITIELTPELTT